MLRQDDLIKGQLVLTGWKFGAEYGGHLASCKIMWCLANRVRLGWGSWLEVIERIPNFHAEKVIPELKKFPSIWDNQLVRLLHEVDSIYDGSGQDLAFGAVYWCDTRRVDNDWFKKNILRQPDAHPKVTDMNSLAFFR